MAKIVLDKRQYLLDIQATLNRLDEQIIGSCIPIKELCEILECELFAVFSDEDFNLNELDFTVERQYQKDLREGDIFATGEYVSLENWRRKRDIEEALTIFLSTRDGNVYFTEEKWDKFKFSLLQTLIHELVHVDQSRKRFGEVYITARDYINTEDRYFSDKDEIDAYAFNGAVDLIALEKTLNDAGIDVTWSKILREGSAKLLSIEFASYYGAFEKSNRKILNRYLKRVWKYVNYLLEDQQNELRQQAS